MTFVRNQYRVDGVVNLSLAEVDELIDFSQYHHDPFLSALGKQGGFLYGWRNHFDCRALPDDRANLPITGREASSLAAIIENRFSLPQSEKYGPWWEFFVDVRNRLQSESVRLNQPGEPK